MKLYRITTMLTGFYLCFLCILPSCKVHEQPSSDDFSDMSQERIVGVVHKSDECGYYIESTSEEKKVLYMPENLEEKFRVEGMKLKFGFKATQTKQTKTCSEFKPVLLSEVDAVR